MMKKLFAIILSFSIVFCLFSEAHASELTTSNTLSYAYSMGTLFPDGSDFTNNVISAADIYGTISNFRSFYQNEPTYSYLIGNNPAGIPKLASEIVFLNGHGSPNSISLNYSGGNYRVTTGYNSASNNSAGLLSIDMSTCSLISFVGCSTAGGSTNLPSVAVSQGAKCAIGFTDSIYSRFYNGPDWLNVFNNYIADGYTVEEAVDAACWVYPNDSLTEFVSIYGDFDTTPAIATRSTSLSEINSELYNEFSVEEKNPYILGEKISSINVCDGELSSEIDLSNYSIRYNTYIDSTKLSKTKGVAIYKINEEIETNAAYFLNYENEKLITVGCNRYVDEISNIDVESVCNAVTNFKTTDVYKNIKTTSFDNEDYEETFFFELDTFTLTYRAWAIKNILKTNGESFEEPIAIEILIPIN